MESGELKKKNNIQERTLEFAVDIINFSQLIPKNAVGSVVTKQIVRSGTSIGSNTQEANDASSRKDFIQKLLIALREARETHYWLSVIIKSGIVESNNVEPYLKEVNELIAILVTIIKKAKTT